MKAYLSRKSTNRTTHLMIPMNVVNVCDMSAISKFVICLVQSTCPNGVTLSVPDIAAILGVKELAVRKSLTDLRRAGYLELSRFSRKSDKRTWVDIFTKKARSLFQQ